MSLHKSLIILFLLFFSNLAFSQYDCFYIDKTNGLTYSVEDSTIYSGDCKKLYKKGNPKEIRSFSNGYITFWKLWYKSGNLKDSTIYSNNSKNAETHLFYKDGIKKAIYKWYLANSLKDSIIDYITESKILFYKSGVTKSKTIYNKIDSTQYVTEYFKTGTIKNSGSFREITIRKGKLIHVIDVKRVGEHIKYREDGIIKVITNFKNDSRDGVETEFRATGSIETKSFYKNGGLEKIITFYHFGGKVSKIENYKKGHLHGKLTKYRADGSKEFTETYNTGRLDGYRTIFYENGRVKEQQQYDNGTFRNPAKRYNPEGIEFKVTYLKNTGGKPFIELRTKKVDQINSIK